jgi:hypothetical protein
LALGDDLDVQVDNWTDADNIFKEYEKLKFKVSKTKTSKSSGVI